MRKELGKLGLLLVGFQHDTHCASGVSLDHLAFFTGTSMIPEVRQDY